MNVDFLSYKLLPVPNIHTPLIFKFDELTYSFQRQLSHKGDIGIIKYMRDNFNLP
jgi:hypothetical protein